MLHYTTIRWQTESRPHILIIRLTKFVVMFSKAQIVRICSCIHNAHWAQHIERNQRFADLFLTTTNEKRTSKMKTKNCLSEENSLLMKENAHNCEFRAAFVLLLVVGKLAHLEKRPKSKSFIIRWCVIYRLDPFKWNALFFV